MAELTATELATLAQCERDTAIYESAWVVAGRALRTIRDEKLYRADFGTFDKYLVQRVKFSRSTAYRLMDGSAVLENVPHGGHFERSPERQVRPLTKLDPDQQREAWQMACAAAPKDDDGQPMLTRTIVEHAVDKLEPPDPKNVVPLRRVKEVTIPTADAERAVRILLKACEQRDLVELLSELGYTLHRIGAVTGWIEVMRTWLARKGVA